MEYNEDISKGEGEDEIFSHHIIVIEFLEAEFLPWAEILLIEFSQYWSLLKEWSESLKGKLYYFYHIAKITNAVVGKD